VTDKTLDDRCRDINTRLGIDPDDWRAVGRVERDSAYGETGVVQVINEARGMRVLLGYGTKREALRFLDGMIAALRITQGATP